jgi:hypothetical protein
MAFVNSHSFDDLGFGLERHRALESRKKQSNCMVYLHSDIQYDWYTSNNLYFVLSEKTKVRFAKFYRNKLTLLFNFNSFRSHGS